MAALTTLFGEVRTVSITPVNSRWEWVTEGCDPERN